MTAMAEQSCRHGLAHLVSRMGAGDVAAFGRLYDRIGPLVFAVSCHAVRRALAGSTAAHQRAAAEAATVQAFVVMWQPAPLFDAASTSAATWLLDWVRAARDPDGSPALEAEPAGRVGSGCHPAATQVNGASTGTAAPGVDGREVGAGASPALVGRGARWPSAQQRGSGG